MRNLPEDLSENPTLESIARLIGADQAARISQAFGGLKLYIPKAPGEHSALSVVIGLEDARTIAEIWGGMELVVPITLGKNAEAKSLLKSGMSVSRVVRHLRCSRSYIYRLRAEIESDLQLDMFPDL
jgi:hypothetical protein